MTPRRALVLAPRLPEYDRESGSRRVFNLVQMLLEVGWDVIVGAEEGHGGERYVQLLEQMGVETHLRVTRLDQIGMEAPDVAFLFFWHLAERHLPALRRSFPGTQVIVDSVDLHFIREARQRWYESDDQGGLDHVFATGMARELNTYAAADLVLTVSDKEATWVNDLAGLPGLAHTIPDCEALDRSPLPFEKRRGILFLGNFWHAPNRDAAAFLCREIVPRLDPALVAEHEVLVVGNELDEQIRELGHGLTGVRTVGWVPSVVPYLHRARVSIIPLRYGAGTKRKLIQALMAGTPTVTTTVGAEGLGVVDGRHVLVADDPDEFAVAVTRLLTERRLWRRLARRGREHILPRHGWAVAREQLRKVLEEVLATDPKQAVPDPSRTLRGGGADPGYARVIDRVREFVVAELPEGATVAVISKGDDELVTLPGRRGWHFPREEDGRYAGHHPSDGEAAIRHLEELRDRGAGFLLIPSTAFWWLAYYDAFAQHLRQRYRRMWGDGHLVVYDLSISQERAKVAPTGRTVQTSANGNGGASRPAAEMHRPKISALASPPGSNGGYRALVLGVYLADEPNNVEDIVARLADSTGVAVRQRWVALGGDPPGPEVAAVTSSILRKRVPKYAILNDLLATEDLGAFEFVLTVDDDIVVPRRFLDFFLPLQARLGFAIAQPPRTSNSYIDHPIVEQQRGVLARETLFVEIGPVVSVHRDAFDVVFPFDLVSPMGWGYENVWSHEASAGGLKMGIVDAVPVDHSLREPVANYSWDEADRQRAEYLRRNPHRPLQECLQVLDVIPLDEVPA
jgi:glycosyltransferase involved in cell wall biosynthesis